MCAKKLEEAKKCLMDGFTSQNHESRHHRNRRKIEAEEQNKKKIVGVESKNEIKIPEKKIVAVESKNEIKIPEKKIVGIESKSEIQIPERKIES